MKTTADWVSASFLCCSGANLVVATAVLPPRYGKLATPAVKLFDILAILITFSALFSYLNHRFLRFPRSIGLMVIAIVLSLLVTMLGGLGLEIDDATRSLVASIDFNRALMGGMLSFLLFAGALHVNLADLSANKWTIGLLASAGVVASALVVGILSWWIFQAVSFPLPFLYCLLFGALISPTDPVAVLSILKSAGVPRSLQAKISGESLFNDGVGVVVFSVLLEIAIQDSPVEFEDALGLLAREAFGGVLLGLATGYVAYRMLKSVDSYQVEVMVTLALVTGGYSLAMNLHTSGPICVVVSGLMIGNRGRRVAMSQITREHLDNFWELVDEILNGVLFILIGLEVLILSFTTRHLFLALLIIPVVIGARFVTVGLPVTLMRFFRDFSPGAVRIITWGGLRGGISVALALSLPAGPERALILPLTYCVVVFSIVVQGLSIGWLVRRTQPKGIEN